MRKAFIFAAFLAFISSLNTAYAQAPESAQAVTPEEPELPEWSLRFGGAGGIGVPPPNRSDIDGIGMFDIDASYTPRSVPLIVRALTTAISGASIGERIRGAHNTQLHFGLSLRYVEATLIGGYSVGFADQDYGAAGLLGFGMRFGRLDKHFVRFFMQFGFYDDVVFSIFGRHGASAQFVLPEKFALLASGHVLFAKAFEARVELGVRRWIVGDGGDGSIGIIGRFGGAFGEFHPGPYVGVDADFRF